MASTGPCGYSASSSRCVQALFSMPITVLFCLKRLIRHLLKAGTQEAISLALLVLPPT